MATAVSTIRKTLRIAFLNSSPYIPTALTSLLPPSYHADRKPVNGSRPAI